MQDHVLITWNQGSTPCAASMKTLADFGYTLPVIKDLKPEPIKKFDEKGRLIYYDNNGIVNTYEYDTKGRIVKRVDNYSPKNILTTTYKYDKNGNICFEENSRGFLFESITTDFPAEEKSAERKLTTRTRSENGHPIKESVSYYNKDGKIIKFIDYNGTVTETEYDGHLTSKTKSTSKNGIVNERHYRRNLLVYRRHNNHEEWFEYNEGGTMMSNRDSNGNWGERVQEGYLTVTKKGAFINGEKCELI